MIMRVSPAVLLFVPWILLAADIGRNAGHPRLANSNSPWNVLVYGGKGEMHGAPICHSLAYFARSPLPLDFDSDFFGVQEADLITHANVTLLGAIDGQRIYEMEQTVARNANLSPTMKILLVERRTDEFCDIYENQYTYDPRQETDEAIILDISGQKVLKTYETDKHTWFLAYWAIKNHRPVRLNIGNLYPAIHSVSPPGALAFREALNIKGSHFAADIFGGAPQQDALGRIELQLAVERNKIVAVKKAWIPIHSVR